MTLNDIRKKSGLLIIVIGVAMLGFILTDLMNSGSSLFQKGQNTLLKVDDKKIMFTNFEMELEKNINMKFMSSLGTVNVTEEQRQSERDLLFDKTIENILLEEKLKQSGVNVGDKESWDLISGEYTGNQSNLFGFFF
ncbi:MAG: SurA N-terminal domain-containing protein, partial [Bacteroidota bacterium]|nr:SurA N-terminal domain-containing protein [Bacteroidota bacterium]